MTFLRKDNFKKIEESSFNSFNAYDSEADKLDPAPAPRVRVPSSFDLKFVNSGASALTFELFNVLNSFMKKIRLDFVVATYHYVPFLSLEGLALAGVGVVAFDQLGNLQITGSGGAPAAVLSCQQFPYAGLMESSGDEPFLITKIRQKSTTDLQIDNQITYFQSTFLGSSNRNVVSPRQFFNPDQQQPLIVDIPVNFEINSTRGLLYVVNAGETVNWNVSILRRA